MKKCILVCFLCILGWQSVCWASKNKKTEADYVAAWCPLYDGKIEVTLSDKTRCDCLTPTYAIEADFAPKWTAAVGQSLHYAIQTGKKAGIVLILRTKNDLKHLKRLQNTIEYYKLPITVWRIDDFQEYKKAKTSHKGN